MTIAASTLRATELSGQQLSSANVQDCQYFHISASEEKHLAKKLFREAKGGKKTLPGGANTLTEMQFLCLERSFILHPGES